VTILCSRDAGQPEFFLANCDCGWIGETLETEREARADGTGHSTNVRLEVEYPLGE
jgi:hypothetical protein